ncbi:MAG TPA: hypothetical protein DDW52_15070 [Planctomycetaceae bacterium]|nr:hypothetical protein [Planctomycetaceae bacterium]
MDSEKYHEACKWFEVLKALAGDELAEKMAELENEDAEIQNCVRRMLLADGLASKEGFLSNIASCEGTLTLGAHIGDSDYLPATIGDFQVRGILGSGGMGVVYKAYDPKTDRVVAVKVIRSHQFSSQDQVQRFHQEAQAAARLRHPNIVAVYATGEDCEVDYIAMQFVDGSNLHTLVRKETFAEDRAAHILSRLCEAVGFAHECGIVHRDIKPGNVMLSHDDFPMLMDFGLAKPLDATDGQTQTGQILGTIGFMAPEQISDAKTAGVSSDIYGLGATLYFCLTGRAPFEEANPITLLRTMVEREPIPPGDIRAGLSRSLQAICIRCLQSEPRDRYATTYELREDIQRYLADEPLSAIPDSRLRSLARVFNKTQISGDLPSAPATGWLAGLSFAFHVSVFLITKTDQPSPWLWFALGLWFLASNVVNYVYHWSRYWQLTPMERQSGLVQLGMNAVLLFLFLMHGPLSTSEPADKFLAIYPAYTLLLGVALIAHGSVFAGRLLLVAAFFFPLALLTHAFPQWAPIILCVIGTTTLVALDLVLRRHGKV